MRFRAAARAGVAVDGINTLNFALTRAMVPLGGSVSASTGERIAGATITVLDGPNTGETAVTNEGGDYRFSSLATGNTNFKATATGHDEDSRGTLVNGTNSLNFTLTPMSVNIVPSITITAVIVSGGPGTAAQEWRFTSTTNQTFVSYDWDFGDSTSATDVGAEVQHVYSVTEATAGAHTVTVTGVRADGTTPVGTLVITLE